MVTWDRESRRQSLWLWVHECEECGFVAPELRNSAPSDARHVASRAYRAELNRLERERLAGAQAMKSVVGGDEALLADLSRRAGAFEQAYRYCQAGLTLPDLPPFMKRLLLFERQLAVECDTACHTVAEAQGEPDAGDGAASAETLH